MLNFRRAMIAPTLAAALSAFTVAAQAETPYAVTTDSGAGSIPGSSRPTALSSADRLSYTTAFDALRRGDLEAARVAAVSGIPAVLTCASNAGPAMMGDPVGTAFAPINDRGSSRRLWIGFASHPQGALVADSGAAKAVRGGTASLLAAGVVEVKGDFAAGDAVWVDDEQGNHLAKGLVGFDSEEIPQMLGRNTAQLKRFLGEEYAHPLVHRDNLVLV